MKLFDVSYYKFKTWTTGYRGTGIQQDFMMYPSKRGYTDIDQEHKNKTIWNGSSSEVI